MLEGELQTYKEVVNSLTVFGFNLTFGPDFLTYMLKGEPRTYKEVVNSIEGLMWKEVITSEIESILHNHSWELVNLPPGCKPLRFK